MDLGEARIYDPRCDNLDVAMRAVARTIENDRHDLLESYDLDWETVRSKVDALGMHYGSFHSRAWYNPEMMKVLRKHLPELIPVAETWLTLYVLVTRHETRVRKGRVA